MSSLACLTWGRGAQSARTLCGAWGTLHGDRGSGGAQEGLFDGKFAGAARSVSVLRRSSLGHVCRVLLRVWRRTGDVVFEGPGQTSGQVTSYFTLRSARSTDLQPNNNNCKTMILLPTHVVPSRTYWCCGFVCVRCVRGSCSYSVCCAQRRKKRTVEDHSARSPQRPATHRRRHNAQHRHTARPHHRHRAVAPSPLTTTVTGTRSTHTVPRHTALVLYLYVHTFHSWPLQDIVSLQSAFCV